MAKKKTIKGDVAAPKSATGFTRVSQGDFPSMPFSSAVRVAQALHDNFGGRSGAPHDVALALNLSPTSSAWRMLAGASIAYGLTEGGYNADWIKLTALGRRFVSPEDEDDIDAARLESVLRPRIIRMFFEKYDRAKFPQDVIAQNVLASLGLPRERAPEALETLKKVGRESGIIRETKTGPFVAIGNAGGVKVEAVSTESPDELKSDSRSNGPNQNDSASAFEAISADGSTQAQPAATKPNNRVFISHGKSRSVVIQIKELLTFGGFEPIVSVDQERTAIPVPDKVFEDMRSCSAGVIHVGGEGNLLDRDGREHPYVNQNVLIEIGAALALYRKRVILLVERGLQLPSNLQGLYRCEYEGDKLDYDATMKLLKTFNQFRDAS